MKIAIIMVGLPASGKTHTARNLSRYLRWMGVPTRTFRVADYRLEAFKGRLINADFFDPQNPENLHLRTIIADRALEDMLCWLEGGSPTAAISIAGEIESLSEFLNSKISLEQSKPSSIRTEKESASAQLLSESERHLNQPVRTRRNKNITHNVLSFVNECDMTTFSLGHSSTAVSYSDIEVVSDLSHLGLSNQSLSSSDEIRLVGTKKTGGPLKVNNIYDRDQVAILDACNIRPERRITIEQGCRRCGVVPLFLECIYKSHESILPEHIRDLLMSSPEYSSFNWDEAIRDFRRRIEFYLPYYVTLDQEIFFSNNGNMGKYFGSKDLEVGSMLTSSKIQSASRNLRRSLVEYDNDNNQGNDGSDKKPVSRVSDKHSTKNQSVEYLAKSDAIKPVIKSASVTVYDGGERVVARKVGGYLPSRILFYLMNSRCIRRRISLATTFLPFDELAAFASRVRDLLVEDCYLSSHTVHEDHRKCDIDIRNPIEDIESSLSLSDSAHENNQPTIMSDSTEFLRPKRTLTVWTETGEVFHIVRRIFSPKIVTVKAKPQLRPMDSIISTEQDLSKLAEAEELSRFKTRPFLHRMSASPESYHDLAMRLENFILELEGGRADEDVLIMAHPTVLRLIYAYFAGTSVESCVSVNGKDQRGPLDAALLNMHPYPNSSLICLETQAFGVTESRRNI